MNEILIKYNDQNISTKKHFHNNHEIIYIIKGKVSIKVNDSKYIASDNSLIFISSLQNHSIKILSNIYKRFYIILNNNILESFLPIIDLMSILNRNSSFDHVINLKSEDENYVKKIFELLLLEYSKNQIYSELAIETYIKQLFIMLFRNYNNLFPKNASTKKSLKVRKIQLFIDNNFKNNITLEILAKKFYLSKYYISHIFKDITGYSFKEYLILKRLQEAKKLLSSSELSISDICHHSGFNNINNFNRTFKKYVSQTPLEFKNYIKKNNS